MPCGTGLHWGGGERLPVASCRLQRPATCRLPLATCYLHHTYHPENKKAALLGAALWLLCVLFFALTSAQQHVILIANNKDDNKDEAKYKYVHKFLLTGCVSSTVSVSSVSANAPDANTQKNWFFLVRIAQRPLYFGNL